jgi:hypothetical protein
MLPRDRGVLCLKTAGRARRARRPGARERESEWQDDLGRAKNLRKLTGARRETFAVCPRRRARTDRRAQRLKPKGVSPAVTRSRHRSTRGPRQRRLAWVGRPGLASCEDLGRHLNGVAPAASTPKYRAPSKSSGVSEGHARDPGEIGKLGRPACDFCGGASRLKIKSAGRRLGADKPARRASKRSL